MLRFLCRRLYLLAVGGSVAALSAGMAFGWPLEAVVLAWSIAVLATGALLERVAPFDPQWGRSRGDGATDAVSAVVLIGLVDPLVKAALPIAALVLLAQADLSVTGWFLSDAPFALQVLVVVLWIEFSKYWSHRAHHRVAGLWWLHALHHGGERLYWLNNFRFHPLNHLFNTLVSLLPLQLLGAPEVVLLGAIALTQPVLMLQHLNARTDSGWLNFILSTNEVHRWHHSARLDEANSNFGSALVLWDQVFGTFRYRADGSRPARIGLFGSGGDYPAGAPYWQQLFSLFTPVCCRA